MSRRRFLARGAPPLLAAGAVELTTSAAPAAARALGQYPVVGPALIVGDVAVMGTATGAVERGSDATLQARRAIWGWRDGHFERQRLGRRDRDRRDIDHRTGQGHQRRHVLQSAR
jgi:hypothetical protein